MLESSLTSWTSIIMLKLTETFPFHVIISKNLCFMTPRVLLIQREVFQAPRNWSVGLELTFLKANSILVYLEMRIIKQEVMVAFWGVCV